MICCAFCLALLLSCTLVAPTSALTLADILKEIEEEANILLYIGQDYVEVQNYFNYLRTAADQGTDVKEIAKQSVDYLKKIAAKYSIPNLQEGIQFLSSVAAQDKINEADLLKKVKTHVAAIAKLYSA